MSSALQDRVRSEVELLRGQGLYRTFRPISGGRFPHVTMEGRQVLILCSNNYLGLAEDERVKAAAVEALRQYGCGPATGRTICGTLDLHIELEQRLARLNRFEAALLFTSAFKANVGLLGAVLREGDTVYSDELNHASIIDGCRLSKARVKVYPHSDLSTLEDMLKETPNEGLRLIITDGVFSMEGDLAKLPQLVDLKRRYDTVLVVDDAHAIGVMGQTGAGTIEHFGLQGQVDIQVGTLGKTLGGALGGYVAGTRKLIEFLAHRARTLVFTNPIPAALAASSLKALDIMQSDSSLREQLWANTRLLRQGLAHAGFHLAEGETPIVPVLIGDGALALRFSDALLEQGIFVQAFAFPVVPKGTARLRCIVSAAHTPGDIGRAVEVFTQVGMSLGVVS